MLLTASIAIAGTNDQGGSSGGSGGSRSGGSSGGSSGGGSSGGNGGNGSRSNGRAGAPVRAGLASFAAAVCTCAILHPLDLIKTRMQVASVGTSAVPVYRGTISAGRWIWRQEGLKGLYKGLSATIIASGVSWGLFRFLFDYSRDIIGRTEYLNIDQSPPKQNFLSSIVSSFLATSVVHPLWLIKTRLEMQTYESKGVPSWTQYHGWWHCVVTITKKEGVRALYRGIGPAIALVPHAALQMFLYEEMKRMFSVDFNGWSSFYGPFVWGASSKFIAILLSYPLQVLRCRQQMMHSPFAHSSFLHVAAVLTRTEGWRSLYRGLAVHVQKACLHNGLLFLVFEGLNT
eukprot:GHVS01043950.1.p1 GENE.GHVS01043950.1~~GHVS01043950.1.p1  ORF type:complete len:344 (+),score=70.84 GHVS01043950.1:114-1145(+)